VFADPAALDPYDLTDKALAVIEEGLRLARTWPWPLQAS
jgi:hypothetical protein